MTSKDLPKIRMSVESSIHEPGLFSCQFRAGVFRALESGSEKDALAKLAALRDSLARETAAEDEVNRTLAAARSIGSTR